MGVVGVPHSGPADALLAEFGIDAKAIAERVRALVKL